MKRFQEISEGRIRDSIRDFERGLAGRATHVAIAALRAVLEEIQRFRGILDDREELRQERDTAEAAVATLRHHFGLHRTEMDMMRDLLSRKQDVIAGLRSEVYGLRRAPEPHDERCASRKGVAYRPEACNCKAPTWRARAERAEWLLEQEQKWVERFRQDAEAWQGRAERAETLLAQAVTGVQFGMPAFPQKYDEDPLGLGRCG